LASIIEKVSGQKFADFLQKSIFKPLKMKNTFVYSRRLNPRKIPNYALGYIFVNEQKRKILPDNFDYFKFVVFQDGIVGDGNISSSVTDLFNWDRALYTNKLVSKASLKEIFTSANLPD
jgi:CubicO group peptidase (beta-lactamase class C family)